MVVTPPRAAARAKAVIAANAAASSRSASRATGSSEASKTVCTWPSTSPGRSVAPPRSMTVRAVGDAVRAVPTATIVVPSSTTVGSGMQGRRSPRRRARRRGSR